MHHFRILLWVFILGTSSAFPSGAPRRACGEEPRPQSEPEETRRGRPESPRAVGPAESPASGEAPSAKAGAPSQSAEAALSLPWDLDREHRFVWIRDSRKVGETRFTVRREDQDGKPVLALKASRTYDHETTSHRADSSTLLREDGYPVRFEETLDISAIRGLRARQVTTVKVADGQAHVKYVHNGKEESPVLVDVECPPGSYLFASQAVEHWAVFTARLPGGEETQELGIVYPDFKKRLRVQFRRAKEEKIQIGGRDVESTRYAFRSDEGQLAGDLWLDAKGRLVQIDFPNPTSRSLGLRVVIASD